MTDVAQRPPLLARCAACGYGVSARVLPRRCPMCGGMDWEADASNAPRRGVKPLLPALLQDHRWGTSST